MPAFRSFSRRRDDLPIADAGQSISEAVTRDVEAERRRTLLNLRRRLADTFTPTRPLAGPEKWRCVQRRSRACFMGREAECLRIYACTSRRSRWAHVVIFGERGRR